MIGATALFPARLSAASRAGGLCAAARAGTAEARIAVLSAFPAELAPLVAAADVEATVEVEDRRYHVGQLEGVRVVLGLTGIGTVNAERTTASVLRRFRPVGVVVSGVAGSRHRIGDVVVAAGWLEAGRRRGVRTNPAMLALLARAAGALPGGLERCAHVPPTFPAGRTVCLPHEPTVVFAEHGRTADPFGGRPFPCVAGGGEVLDCELPPAPAPAARGGAAATAVGPPDVEDMESAVVARLAARRRLPFAALRAVSDGAGDPVGDRGFPAQFFDYYRLAAANAALLSRAWLAEVHRLAHDRSARRVCRLLARGRWSAAAGRLRRL